jgi:hypothetical protein
MCHPAEKLIRTGLPSRDTAEHGGMGSPGTREEAEDGRFVLPDEPHRHPYRNRQSPMAGRSEGAAPGHDQSLPQVTR